MDHSRRAAPLLDTVTLLVRAREGDRDALDHLFARHIPLLRRWAAGRLPHWARQGVDTSDLVQETVIATLRHLDNFEPRGEGALQSYLRRALINAVRTVLRRANVRPRLVPAGSDVFDPAPNPLKTIIDSEMLTRYEAALQRLSASDRDAVVARVEFSMSYGEVAALLDKPSADAARMIVSRALVKLTREMHRASTDQKPTPSVPFSRR